MNITICIWCIMGSAMPQQDNSFVFRHYEPTIPPAVTYGITERNERH